MGTSDLTNHTLDLTLILLESTVATATPYYSTAIPLSYMIGNVTGKLTQVLNTGNCNASPLQHALAQ